MGLFKKIKNIFKRILEDLIIYIIASVIIIPTISILIASRPPIKTCLMQIFKLKEFSLIIVIFSATAAIIAVLWVVFLYWKHELYDEAYGVFWNKNNKMRSLCCKKPFKDSSEKKYLFWCSKCNDKHVLKADDGTMLSRQDALKLRM